MKSTDTSRPFQLYQLMPYAPLELQIEGRPTPKKFSGKGAALIRLAMLVGENGFTTGEAVSAVGGICPRIGSYIDKLRKAGLAIKTRMERISSTTSVARYTLAINFEVLRDEANGG